MARRGAQISASSQSRGLAALLFPSREVLGHDLPWLNDVVRARTRDRVPVVVVREEVKIGSND